MTKRTPIRGTLYQTHALHISLFSLYVYCHSWWRDAKELGDDLIIWSVGEWNGKGILNKSGKPGKIERNHLKRTSITWCSLLSECISPIPKFNKKKIVSPCCKNILSSSGKGWGGPKAGHTPYSWHMRSYLLISTCVFSKDNSFNQQKPLFPDRISELLLKGIQGELLSHLVWFASWSNLGMSQN